MNACKRLTALLVLVAFLASSCATFSSRPGATLAIAGDGIVVLGNEFVTTAKRIDLLSSQGQIRPEDYAAWRKAVASFQLTFDQTGRAWSAAKASGVIDTPENIPIFLLALKDQMVDLALILTSTYQARKQAAPAAQLVPIPVIVMLVDALITTGFRVWAEVEKRKAEDEAAAKARLDTVASQLSATMAAVAGYTPRP